MSINIWMPLYLGDYYNATNHLDCAQHGALKLLIEWQWSKGRGLSANLDELITITRLRPFFVDATSISQASLSHTLSTRKADDSEAVIHMRAWLLDILNEFFERQPDGRWRNLEYWDRRKIWLEKQETFHARAKAGAAARWAGHVAKRPSKVDASSIATKMLKQSPLSSSGKANTSTNGTPSLPARRRAASGPATKRRDGETAEKGPETPRKRLGLPNPHPRHSKASIPPPKSVARVGNKAATPSKTVSAPGTRFGVFRDEIFRYWDRVRHAQIGAGLIDGAVVPQLPPWGPRERVELNAFIAANASMEPKAFAGLLMNRAKSEGQNHFDQPYRWIKSLMMFAAGPVDRFNKKINR